MQFSVVVLLLTIYLAMVMRFSELLVKVVSALHAQHAD